MRHGLLEILSAIRIFTAPDGNYAELKAPVITANYTLKLPAALPTATEAVVIDNAGQIAFQPLGGGGSVTSVALALPTIFSVSGSPVTASGTLTATLASQAAGSFFAAPTSATGEPTFRAIAYSDLAALVGSAASTLAAGNDSRFHTQNTDTGTTAASFQLDSGNTGVRLKHNSAALEVRNAADSAYADLVVNNLRVAGTTTTVNSETVTVDDNVLVLNNNYTGSAPAENGGIEIERGTETNASLIWNESSNSWFAGFAGAEVQIARVFRNSFTNASLVAGVLTVNHNLGNKIVKIQVSDNSNKVIVPDEITLTSATESAVDLTSYGALNGNWDVVVTG